MLLPVRSSRGARQQPRFETRRTTFVQELMNHSTQERHDILKKFYALMQEHTEDLARIIVCMSLSQSCVFPNRSYRRLKTGSRWRRLR